MWESVFVWAAHMFGGFESAHQVYHVFEKEFDKTNTVRQPVEATSTIHVDAVIWETALNGVYIQAHIKRSTETQTAYLNRFMLVSDLKAFGLEARWHGDF